MSAWKLQAGRCITPPDGTFHLTYGSKAGSNEPLFRDFGKLDAIARQVAVLPELTAALQAAHDVMAPDEAWQGSDTLAQIADALAKVQS